MPIITDPESELHPYTGNNLKHDIFVSYSHGIQSEDEEDSDLKTWTHELIKKLEEHIRLSLREQSLPVSIWYDKKLPGNTYLTDTLKQKVENSATILIIMTPFYLLSEWCQKEIEWFRKEISRRDNNPIKNVFVVKALPTKGNDWPDFLKDDCHETILGFPFCNEKKGREARPYGWVTPQTSLTKGDFDNSLTKLASEIATRLDDIRKDNLKKIKVTSNRFSEDTPSTSNFPIFVAPGTEDVQPYINDIRSALDQKGCTVYPADNIRIDKFTQQAEEKILKNAKAFVQCLGLLPAKEDDSQKEGKVQLLNQSVGKHSIPQFIWRNQSIPLEALYDPVYKEFVNGLTQINDCSATEFADQIIAELNRNSTDQPIIAFMEAPSEASDDWEKLRNNISNPDCLVLPLKAPQPTNISQIQNHRKSRQLIFQKCKVFLLIYCIRDRLKWLNESIINYLKDTNNGSGSAPIPLIIDYVGEAEELATILGVEIITGNKQNLPNQICQTIKKISV